MLRARRRGAAAIEFALTSIAFFLMLFIIIDYGWLFLRRANIQDAVFRGARAGSVVATSSNPAATATAEVQNQLTAHGIDPGDVAISAAVSGTTPTQVITVSADMPYVPPVNFSVLPVPDRIGATMSMHLEVQ